MTDKIAAYLLEEFARFVDFQLDNEDFVNIFDTEKWEEYFDTSKIYTISGESFRDKKTKSFRIFGTELRVIVYREKAGSTIILEYAGSSRVIAREDADFDKL